MSDTSQSDPAFLFEFFNEIGIVNQLISTEFQKALPRDLSQSEFGVLNHFVRMGDGKSPSWLANAFQMTKPSMTAILAKLEQKGFVTLESHPSDARQKVVRITEAGREARARGIAATVPLANEVISGLDLPAMRKALPMLRQVRAYLDERRNG